MSADPRAELNQWWLDLAQAEADRVVDKAIEYGATDLVDIGQVMLRCQGRVGTDAHAAELGVFFYALGKMSRWSAAIAEGRSVSMDTLEDIGVYVRMAQRIRQTGAWPGTMPMQAGEEWS